MTDQSSGLPDVTNLLLNTESFEEFLQALADSALELTPTAHGAGITVEQEHRPVTVVSAGAQSRDLDEAQYGQDDGPCLTALRTGEEVLVPDMLGEHRWGPYPAYAASCGTLSSLSLPIAARTHTAGALNLYSPKADGFADAGLGDLRELAAQASGAIAVAQRLADTRQYAADLQEAMRSRSVIDQAIGVIMGQQRCPADEAFGLLRAASQRRNVKLRDLCAELLTNVGGRPAREGRPLRPRP
ncbi:GAF and ANTAR domain-containing protein [Streptomyces sp. NPDC003697]